MTRNESESVRNDQGTVRTGEPATGGIPVRGVGN